MNAPVARRLLHGVGWNALGVVAGRGADLAAAFLVARLLGGEAFGLLGIVLATVVLLQTVGTLGLRTTAVRLVAETRRADPALCARWIRVLRRLALRSSAVTAAALLVLGGAFGSDLLHSPRAGGLLAVGSLNVLLGALALVLQGVLAGFEAFRAGSAVLVAAGLLSAALQVLGAWVLGIPGVLLGQALALALQVGLLEAAVARRSRQEGLPTSDGPAPAPGAELRDTAVPALLATSLASFVFWAVSAVVVRQPDGLREMGVLAAANHWRLAVLFLPGMIGQVTLPVLAELASRGELQAVRRIVGRFTLGTLAAGALYLLAMLPLGGPLMGLYGPEFAGGRPTFLLLQGAAVLQAAQTPLVSLLAARGRMWLNFGLNVVWAASVLGLAVAFRSRGSEGAALALCAGFAVFSVPLLATAPGVLRGRAPA